jgi:hypothetical protein
MSEIVEQQLGNGNTLKYIRLPSGTCYHAETPKKVINLLEKLLKDRAEVRIFYGNTDTGQSWFEENDVVGRIDRSTGSVKIPLLVPVGDSGGPGLLDHCIIRIDARDRTLYKHKSFRVGDMTLSKCDDVKYPWVVFIDNVLHARFEFNVQAIKLMDFLQGNVFAM